MILLSNEYPPFIFGGIGTFTRDLAQALLRKGVKVTVVSGRPMSNPFIRDRSPNERDEAGITVLRLPYPDIPPRHTMFQLANLKNLYNYVRNVDADIIHGQSGSSFPASYSLKNLAPFVVTFHTSPRMQKIVNTYSLLRGGSITDFMTFVLGYPAWSCTFKRELDISRLAVAVSRNLMLDLLSEMGESYKTKIRAIHNGVDIETLDKDYSSVKSIDGEPDRTILFAGRLFWGKGVLRLVEIAQLLQKEMPGFKIVVHGKGPLFGKLSMQIKELGLVNLELSGFANRTQLMRSMRRSSFVIVPSYYEACPMVLLEGMCLGKIPLMLNFEYALEFTENGTYGVIAKNSMDMVTKLKQLGNERDLTSLSNEVRIFARKEYDITETAEKYYKLYTEICN